MNKKYWAKKKILSLETRLFHELVLEMANFITPIQLNAQILGRLDCLFSFSTIAHKYNYCRPEINEGLSIDIINGRHPVIEQSLEIGEKYIANDIHLNQETQQIMMITGPNMSGKSALIRQADPHCDYGANGLFCAGLKCKNRFG